MGKAEHDDSGPRPGRLPAVHEVGKEVLVRTEPHLLDIRPGEEGGIDVDGVTRSGDQGGVARPDQGPHQVG